MPPTPPSSKDDLLDLGDLDMKPAGGKSKSPESDFEKELEALFAEELASSDEKPASAPPVGAPQFEEDVLLLDDLVADAPAAPVPGAPVADEEILDLGDFAADGALDITPPDETPGGKDGGIDTGALDDLISGLGEPQKPAAEPFGDSAHAHADVPLDSTDMSELLESLDVPKAQQAAAPAAEAAEAPGEDLLELSLGDLVEEPAAAAPEPAPELAAEPMDLGGLELTLPDLSDPEPGRDLIAEQEQADMGGELNLSDLAEEAPAASGAGLDQLLDSGDLDMTGLDEAAPAEEPAPAPSLDPKDLLDQISEEPAAPAAPAGLDLEIPAPVLPLADAALAATAASVTAAVVTAAPAAQQAPSGDILAELQARFADLTTQVTGSGVALMRLEGRLAEKDRALAELESTLKASQTEAAMLRSELTDLRGQLEETLRARAQDAEKDATSLKERLALVEDRQAQLDSEVHTEIARAVPREAARVIREEIAALAASMREE